MKYYNRQYLKNAYQTTPKPYTDEFGRDLFEGYRELINNKAKVTEDMSMAPYGTMEIIDVSEETRTEIVDVPQHKAPPKKETRTYKIVKVEFFNGHVSHVREAVCMPEDIDNYDINIGITICCMKEFCGGTKAYNDMLRKANKLYKNKLIEEKKKKENAEIAARRKAKNEKRKAEMKARKAEIERKEKIDLISEAIIKALDNKKISSDLVKTLKDDFNKIL